MMENTSECSLCLDPFKDPRILSCIHTFCHDCLDLYVSTYKRSDNSGDKFDCPVCRTTITLPDSGVAGLQKNFYLNQDPKLDHPLCALHSREDLRFYCRECKEAICRDCKVVSHNGHAIDMADSVVTELREELKELINETEKTINENEIRQRSVIETGQGSLETTLAIIEINAGMMKKEIDRLLQFTQNLLLPDIKSKKKKAFFLQTSYEIKHGKLAEFKNLFSDADRKGGNVFKVYKEIMHKLPEINELKEAPLSFDTECNNEDCLDYTKLVNEFDLLRNDLRQQATKFTNTEFNIKRTEHTDIEKASSGKRAQSPKPCPARGKKWRRSDVGIVSQEGKNRVEMSFEKGQCSDILPTPGPSRQRQLFSGSGILINSQPSCSTSHPQQKSYLSSATSATTDKPQKCNRASETCTAVSSEPKSGKQSSGKLVDLNSPLDIPNKSDVPTNSPVILEGARVMLKGGDDQQQTETVKKCGKFLSAVIELASSRSEANKLNVRDLIQSLIDGKIEPELFTERLLKEWNSSPRPYLMPFLKKSLPLLRQLLITNKMTIDGVGAPPVDILNQTPLGMPPVGPCHSRNSDAFSDRDNNKVSRKDEDGRNVIKQASISKTHSPRSEENE